MKLAFRFGSDLRVAHSYLDCQLPASHILFSPIQPCSDAIIVERNQLDIQSFIHQITLPSDVFAFFRCSSLPVKALEFLANAGAERCGEAVAYDLAESLPAGHQIL
jgi:hypothetical protein